ncbi:LutC/YkgG family protein [Flavobacterium nackdongense]|uniref:Lactate utilization protein B/C n=1 Tax=Flavobacterium nackdongense TaxID=2547394 RepID=A0A4P6YH36_9FLAO|nr:LUD domain-containing protein [Flavobacterium nackdongense]QBN20135.1 lactate utilization protein B/C [Flavobacterium nackdongense]
MSSRDKILNAIAANQPDLVAPPTIDLDTVISYEDNYTQFKKVLEGIGGKVELLSDIAILNNQIQKDKASGQLVINMIDDVDKQIVMLTSFELEKLEKVYLRATLGVAENGSVWLYESQMGNRLLPFICQHLMLVIHKKDIVTTMHHAYQQIDIAKEGFGVFIAGPSKTADIEQSLVIGAHGARTATIYVVE